MLFQEFIHSVVSKTGYGEPTLWNAWQLYDPLFVEVQYKIGAPYTSAELREPRCHLTGKTRAYRHTYKGVDEVLCVVACSPCMI